MGPSVFEEDPNAHISSLPINNPSQPRAGVHPIQTLPPEILGEIFVDFLPPYPGLPPLSGLLSPHLLCRICRQWRAIALSTPRLWSAIRIDAFQNDSDAEQARKLEILKTWLTRSSNCPLSLSLSGASYAPLLGDFIEAILAHRARWEHVDVLVPPKAAHLMRGEMPLLRSLTFGPILHYRGPTGASCSLFDHAPLLTDVVLGGNFFTNQMRFPWAQLTHLNALCLIEWECADVLREAPRLVSFEVRVAPNPSNRGEDVDVPVHLLLRDLILRPLEFHSSGYQQWNVLDRLTLPALCKLQVSEAHVTLRSLKAFMLRSRCTLEELRVVDATLAESVFREILPPFGPLLLKAKAY
ncbi:hypothetical protein C8F04DRAFT_1075526 [Mycena alexandri]|uniref:F-box domain-containing protein n=1 Tax=Mycena alexandri TaxID=1745969 RepID=A0AAD6XCG8_9AGAR|nr:hypothetical protein C8F04DRAFT_1075526 [Mycena alexandri]